MSVMHHPGHDLALFDHVPRTRIVFGPGSVDRTGPIAAEWSARRVLLVTDAHIVAAGHAPRAVKSLEAAGIRVALFDKTRENPTTDDVDRCLALARDFQPDTLVGIGGGSSLDTAKGCNFLLTSGGKMADYWGVGKATQPMLPLIAIPTTAGTGSECQSFALIADAKTHVKMACGDTRAAPRVAILDPALSVTQPRLVTADTGIDALTHAVETAVTKRATELSLIFSHEALRLIAAHFPTVLHEPKNIEARGHMLLAAAFAGTAIENSMLGAAHSAANPLTAHFNVVHGQAVGLMLPAVVRFNARDAETRSLYKELAVAARLSPPDAEEDSAVADLLACVDKLLHAAKLPRSLSHFKIPRTAIPMLADEAAKQWTAQFNPRPVAAGDFVKLYEEVF